MSVDRISMVVSVNGETKALELPENGTFADVKAAVDDAFGSLAGSMLVDPNIPEEKANAARRAEILRKMAAERKSLLRHLKRLRRKLGALKNRNHRKEIAVFTQRELQTLVTALSTYERAIEGDF